MKSEVFNYSITKEDLFENILTDENLMLNHVVIEPGKVFPKHPTDAMVYIIIMQGKLYLTVEEEEEKVYQPGQVVHVKKGIETILGNKGEEHTEVFVIKI